MNFYINLSYEEIDKLMELTGMWYDYDEIESDDINDMIQLLLSQL